MTTDTATRPVFRIERTFAAPRPVVWDAWTLPDQMAQWFGPRGCDTQVVSADIRAGGILHSRMTLPDGNAVYARFVYREVTPPSRLVYEHGFGDADGNPARPFVPNFPMTLLTTVDLTDQGESTHIVLTWTPLEATPDEIAEFARMMSGMDAGWTGSFDALDALLAAR